MAGIEAHISKIQFSKNVVAAIISVCAGIWAWRTTVYQNYASTHQFVNSGRVLGGGHLRGPKREIFIDEQLMMSLRNFRQGRLYISLQLLSHKWHISRPTWEPFGHLDPE